MSTKPTWKGGIIAKALITGLEHRRVGDGDDAASARSILPRRGSKLTSTATPTARPPGPGSGSPQEDPPMGYEDAGGVETDVSVESTLSAHVMSVKGGDVDDAHHEEVAISPSRGGLARGDDGQQPRPDQQPQGHERERREPRLDADLDEQVAAPQRNRGG